VFQNFLRTTKRFKEKYPGYDPYGLEDKFHILIDQKPSTPVREKKKPVSKHRTSEEILPQPFAWIEIPELTGETTPNMPGFAVAKYPLTNAQFALFIEANGYSERQWWQNIDPGWEAKNRVGWKEPQFWQRNKLNKHDHPVVGVSWYEAVAFCQWLSDFSGEPISLLTQQQWQFAAQGNNKRRLYPWGWAFDKNRCNFNTSATTPVTQYESTGKSPLGVVDMSGNVQEWCLTKFDTGGNELTSTDRRVVCGGSFNSTDERELRVDYSKGYDPLSRINSQGFRITRLLPAP
jgi:formylglycine-generating enzyme required for sulfatase activity